MQIPISQNGTLSGQSSPADTDAIETYFECITTCSVSDGECITRCVEDLRDNN